MVAVAVSFFCMLSRSRSCSRSLPPRPRRARRNCRCACWSGRRHRRALGRARAHRPRHRARAAGAAQHLGAGLSAFFRHHQNGRALACASARRSSSSCRRASAQVGSPTPGVASVQTLRERAQQQHSCQQLQLHSWARPSGSGPAPALHPPVDRSSAAARRCRAARILVVLVVDTVDQAQPCQPHAP